MIPKLILDQFWVSFAVHVIETRGNIATGKELRPASFLAMINDSVQTFEIEQLPMNPQVHTITIYYSTKLEVSGQGIQYFRGLGFISVYITIISPLYTIIIHYHFHYIPFKKPCPPVAALRLGIVAEHRGALR